MFNTRGVFDDIVAQERVQLQKLLKYSHRFPILLTSDVYGAYEKYLPAVPLAREHRFAV